MTQDNLRDYTYTGSFSLKSGNTILGEIRYVENVTKHYKLYRVADFINSLKLPRNYTTKIESRYRFPGTRHCWAPWVSIRESLRNLNRPTNIIVDVMNRQAPEESKTSIKFEKENKLLDFLLRLPNDKLLLALASFDLVSKDFGTWIRQFGGNAEDFLMKDLEEFSAMDFVDLLKSYNFKIVKASDAEKQSSQEVSGVSVKTLEGRNFQIVLNLKLS